MKSQDDFIVQILSQATQLAQDVRSVDWLICHGRKQDEHLELKALLWLHSADLPSISIDHRCRFQELTCAVKLVMHLYLLDYFLSRPLMPWIHKTSQSHLQVSIEVLGSQLFAFNLHLVSLFSHSFTQESKLLSRYLDHDWVLKVVTLSRLSSFERSDHPSYSFYTL